MKIKETKQGQNIYGFADPFPVSPVPHTRIFFIIIEFFSQTTISGFILRKTPIYAFISILFDFI
jgi:hypothetical protein